MSRTPSRTVARFLIPMVDVLILLLCVFLLTPLMGNSQPGATEEPVAVAVSERLAAVSARLRQTEFKLRSIENERKRAFQGLRIVVLDIDSTNGRLFYSGPLNTREQLETEGDVLRLIQRCKAAAGASSVGFLIRYPRELSGFPLREQIAEYRFWFRNENLLFETNVP